MDDAVELDSKMGTKKRLKMEAKAEKQRQREVKNGNFRDKVLKSVFQQDAIERQERREREEQRAEERRQKELEEERREKEQVITD